MYEIIQSFARNKLKKYVMKSSIVCTLNQPLQGDKRMCTSKMLENEKFL